MAKVTCIATDWSQNGIVFFLLQKNCSCKDITPVCCADGWKLVFAGSRFTSGAESRYAPVEGEMLAVVWALEKAKHFILGCPTLYLAVDHQPLLRLLNDKHLEDIPNRRLLNLKEKTLRYTFSLVHVPGRLNKAADAASRYPTSTEEQLQLASLARTYNSIPVANDHPVNFPVAKNTSVEDWRMSKNILAGQDLDYDI